MIYFTSDYIAGCHEEVLKALNKTNLENLSGYMNDKYCRSAAKRIKETFNINDADVYFLVGGTQANQVVIDTMLNKFEGVISAKSGHINVHEAGAIEYTGHKILEVKTINGKINAKDVEEYIKSFYKEPSASHMVYPGMVYVSFPTEYGTLYSKKELNDLHQVCKKYKIPFFIDGARLAYGLESKSNDIKIKEFAKLCDVFYIGGTKCGALCGEAIVFNKGFTPSHFITQVKQHGALLAKGRLLGIQFDTLFKNNLYFDIGKLGIDFANKLKKIFTKKGYKLFIDSPTNQQFIIVPNKKLNELKKKVAFEVWEAFDKNNTVIRFVTSWSTTNKDLEELKKVI